MKIFRSTYRAVTRAAVHEALAAERMQREAEQKRRQELMANAIGQVVLLVEHALTHASCMRCPEGHPGYKNDACNHMNCEANGCNCRYCYACGQDTANGRCGCDEDGIYLQGMPGMEAANGNGNAAVILFHFNRAAAFVQVVKVMVLAAPEIDDNIWTQLHVRHPNLLSSIHGNDGQQLDWEEQQLPAELLQTFGSRTHKEHRLRAQLTQFDAALRRQATEIGLLLPDFDEERLGFTTSQLLRDGTTAEEGVRVLATRASRRGNYMAGCTGTITRLELDNPVVRWDHTGEEHTSNKNNLVVTNVVLQDGTSAAVGVRIVAIAASARGNYAVGQTGVISGIHENNSNPLVRWDHRQDQLQSSRHSLNVTNVVLQDGTPAAVGVRIVAIAHSAGGNYAVGQTGVICGIHRNNTNPLVRWDHRISANPVQSTRHSLNLTNVMLQDGTPAAVGVRIVAIAASAGGNYAVGQTGVICGVHRNNTNPLVQWDHRNDQVQSNRHALVGWQKKLNILHARNPSRFKISSDGAGHGWSLVSSFITHSTQVHGTRRLRILDAHNPHRFKVSENGTGHGWTERADFFAHTTQVAGSIKFIISQAHNPHRFKIGQVEGYGHGWEDVDHFFAFPNNFCFVECALAGLVLDVKRGDPAQGTELHMWEKNHSAAQQFKLVPIVGTEYFYLENALAGLVLDVKRGDPAQGIELQMWRRNGTRAQQFKPVPIDGTEYFYLENALAGLVLDVKGGDPAQGIELQMWRRNGTQAQQFKMC